MKRVPSQPEALPPRTEWRVERTRGATRRFERQSTYGAHYADYEPVTHNGAIHLIDSSSAHLATDSRTRKSSNERQLAAPPRGRVGVRRSFSLHVCLSITVFSSMKTRNGRERPIADEHWSTEIRVARTPLTRTRNYARKWPVAGDTNGSAKWRRPAASGDTAEAHQTLFIKHLRRLGYSHSIEQTLSIARLLAPVDSAHSAGFRSNVPAS